MVVMAPGDERDVAPMLRWALQQPVPVALRYPKAALEAIERGLAPVVLGQAEDLRWATDAILVAFGSLFTTCVKAAARLRLKMGWKSASSMPALPSRSIGPPSSGLPLHPSEIVSDLTDRLEPVFLVLLLVRSCS